MKIKTRKANEQDIRDNAELQYFRRLLKLYPSGFISVVSDTWDYWNTVTNIIPSLKDEIMNRNGRLVVRPDSGDPVKIICGYKKIYNSNDFDMSSGIIYEWENKFQDSLYELNGKYYLLERYGDYIDDLNKEVSEIEAKGTYQLLWETFGGCVNEAGFKVLDSHIGIIYGDSITLERQFEIYRRLEAKGFAATNLVLGIGSYTYCYQTRDSLGWALKTTAVKINGRWIEVFKDPKTAQSDSGMMKKSYRGFVHITDSQHGVYTRDCVKEQQSEIEGGVLKKIYKDGKFLETISLSDIRKNIKHNLLLNGLRFNS